MCLILVREPNVALDYDDIKNAVLNNPDGWGYGIPDRGKLEIRRLYDPKGTDPDDVYEVLDEYQDHKIFLHLRYATAGVKSAKNCHPFPVLQTRKDGMQVWLMHNGTVNEYRPSQSNMSDTFHFTQEIVSPLLKRVVKFTGKKELLNDKFVGQVIRKFAQGWSKFVLFDQYGNHQIVGDGVEKPGYWASNDYSFQRSYRTPPAVKTTTTHYSNPYNSYGNYGHNSQYASSYASEQPWEDVEFEEVDKCQLPLSPASSAVVTSSTEAEEKNKRFDAQGEPEPLEEKDRTSFCEIMGIKNMRELCGLTEEDIFEIVREYPAVAAVCIRDLLWELYNNG